MEPQTEQKSDEQRAVVVAIDESEHSDWAFQWYIANLHRPRDRVILIHCPEYRSMTSSPIVFSDVTAVNSVMHQERERVKALLQKVTDKVKDHGIIAKVRSLGGKPGEVVVQTAADENAAMIVTGSRGLSSIRRTLLGSVSDYILHHSTVPVVVCSHPDSHPHQ